MSAFQGDAFPDWSIRRLTICDGTIDVYFKAEIKILLKNAVFWNVTPCDLVRTDVSEERIRIHYQGDKNR
jgi:hypothetical protein